MLRNAVSIDFTVFFSHHNENLKKKIFCLKAPPERLGFCIHSQFKDSIKI